MKEIKEIAEAYLRHQAAGIMTALATVVYLEGSSYRRPGARMLVSEDGELTGAISGGCLEGDALRKARLAMAQGVPALVKYDTMDDDDSHLGVGLGCNGIIYILIEPLTPGTNDQAVLLLQQALQQRKPAVVVTLFSLQDRKGQQFGTCFLAQEAGTQATPALPKALLPQVEADARHALRSGCSLHTSYAFQEKAYTAFVEVLEPAPALVICGAGNDVMPLVNLAHLLGWPTTVVDGRANYATRARFPNAQRVLISKPEGVLPQMEVDARTVFLLLSHNYHYDLAMLRQLLPLQVPYVGVLGPKKKMERMLSELATQEASFFDPEALKKVYGPVGLDVGAETPEEIALSILSEIKAVLSQCQGGFLREKKAPIHAVGQTSPLAETPL
ncbi:XdhC family protein [Rufibacter ruber]|uniref:XdhC family protein n=1 Tax=Rufibacter ruber TaxID=1783499 RepID=UPI0008368B1B|nr:XdhC/CoxI family protein [Rufibacter ruber]